MAEPVALPPSSWRRASVGLVPIAITLVALIVSRILARDDPEWFTGVLYGLVGLVLLVRAWVIRHRPALLLDDEGIKEWNGTLLVPWSQAALIWAGDHEFLRSRGLLRFTGLWVWTAPSLDYARRTGFAPDVRWSRILATTLTGAELVELLGRFTSAPIRSGTGRDLHRLRADLRSPGSPDKVVRNAGSTRHN